MTPTQVMAAEHRLIENVVKALGRVAIDVGKGRPVDASMLSTAVEFLRLYADTLHHGKEETFFFPVLVKRGVPAKGCPIEGLNHEHEKGRVLVQALAEHTSAYQRGQPEAPEALRQTLRGLLDLYQSHIWKEDAMVFPMADRILTADDQQELSAQFVVVDRAVGLDTIARLEGFARSLSSTALAPRPSQPAACHCGG
ncbi:MAG TPA: hemerythrin domain-containing protein [Verrucomicrobiota bacterium]|nr:hemerythrin domain-containing protein [Verrucomicrobiota bacterium]HRZ36965.1 hemerythrin domain-containing protein [Candidatus Paceibacterota bacterium]HRZ57486.1 hemerythrin domain-containing protein [Candidatus Paceibacterota bacterium]